MGISENPASVAAEEAKKAAENTPQQSPQAPAPEAAPSKVEQTAVAIESSLQDKVGNWLKDVYNSNKILFYTIIPIMGIIYLVIKFHNIIIDFLIGNSKDILKDATEKDAKLAQQADATKAQADALVKTANDLPKQEAPVDQDWDKK